MPYFCESSEKNKMGCSKQDFLPCFVCFLIVFLQISSLYVLSTFQLLLCGCIPCIVLLRPPLCLTFVPKMFWLCSLRYLLTVYSFCIWVANIGDVSIMSALLPSFPRRCDQNEEECTEFEKDIISVPSIFIRVAKCTRMVNLVHIKSGRLGLILGRCL